MDAVSLSVLTNMRYYFNSTHPNQPVSILEHGLSGLAAGLAVSFVATPVELIKARLQVQYDIRTKVYSSPIDCAKQLVIYLVPLLLTSFFCPLPLM